MVQQRPAGGGFCTSSGLCSYGAPHACHGTSILSRLARSLMPSSGTLREDLLQSRSLVAHRCYAAATAAHLAEAQQGLVPFTQPEMRLNKEQQRAAHAPKNKPLVVVAGEALPSMQPHVCAEPHLPPYSTVSMSAWQCRLTGSQAVVCHLQIFPRMMLSSQRTFRRRCAGAGTGKTYMLVARVVHLLREGVSPFSRRHNAWPSLPAAMPCATCAHGMPQHEPACT